MGRWGRSTAAAGSGREAETQALPSPWAWGWGLITSSCPKPPSLTATHTHCPQSAPVSHQVQAMAPHLLPSFHPPHGLGAYHHLPSSPPPTSSSPPAWSPQNAAPCHPQPRTHPPTPQPRGIGRHRGRPGPAPHSYPTLPSQALSRYKLPVQRRVASPPPGSLPLCWEPPWLPQALGFSPSRHHPRATCAPGGLLESQCSWAGRAPVPSSS